MSFLNWTSDDILGIKILDDQHLSLFVLVNKLYETLNTNRTNESINIMDQIVELMKLHFDTENNFMIDNKIMDITHKLEHDRYLDKVIKFNEAFKRDQEGVTNDFFRSFRVWFHNHQIINDKKLGASLKNLGIN
ncbi:MAG: hemerythrin family protein [bacterium]